MGSCSLVRGLCLVCGHEDDVYWGTACNLTGAAIVYFFLYESSDMSLEDVDMVRFLAHFYVAAH